GVASAETAGFLESTALFAQAVSEIHGLPVQDAKRANALVLGLMLGKDGKNLVPRFRQQNGGVDSILGCRRANVTTQMSSPQNGRIARWSVRCWLREVRIASSASARRSAAWTPISAAVVRP